MKGQYLPVESVATIGMGVMVALGTVSAFTTYRSEVLDTATEKQVQTVESRIAEAVYSLEYADRGSTTVELPERIGSQDYTVAMSDDITVRVGGRSFRTPLNQMGSDYDFSGRVEGGDVKIFKQGEEYTLREG